jgi:hypothetical protein
MPIELLGTAPESADFLGPVPEVDVMAKRPQGLLNVGTAFPTTKITPAACLKPKPKCMSIVGLWVAI